MTYLGHSSFKLKGKTSTVVCDPYGDEIGKFPRDVAAEVVTVSHDHFDHNQTAKVKGVPFVISGPGEYEVKGISVIGVPTWHDDNQGGKRGPNTVYVIEIDGLRVVHAGDLGHKLSETQASEIGPVDIALIPVGGNYTIDAKTAAEVAKQLDPWIIVPMHYRQPGINLSGELAGVEDFLLAMGLAGDTPRLAKLVVSKEKLPTETQVVVLEQKN